MKVWRISVLDPDLFPWMVGDGLAVARFGNEADAQAYCDWRNSRLELVPPEPPKPKWEVDWDGRLGKLWKGGEFLGTLRDKGLAEFVRDYLNEQAQ